jgi:carbamoyl-phosphate synthase large subunit
MNVPSKKIMILGAGVYQVPLIHKAKEMGLTTLVVSIAGDYPGFMDADIAINIDVRDEQAIYRMAVEHQIDAIVTNQTDLPVTTAAYVAEKMGLPGIGLACASRFTNKFLMRDVAERCGSATIAYQKVTSLESALAAAENMRYPLVVKPISNQGSRGVSKVTGAEQLARAVRDAQLYSTSDEILVEEYFEGKEIIIDGLMTEQGFQNLPLGDVEFLVDLGPFVSRSVTYPSTIPAALQEKVRTLNERIVRAMGLPFGLTHSEFRVCEETGQVALIETAARGGGTFISSDLVPLACGLDVERILIQQALGWSIPEATQTATRASAYVCAGSLPSGVLIAIKGLAAAERLPGIHRVVIQKKVGETVGPLLDKTSRFAIFLLSGKDREELEQTRRQLSELVSFVVETNDGVVEVSL